MEHLFLSSYHNSLLLNNVFNMTPEWVSNGHRCAGIHQAKPSADPVERDVNVWVNSFSYIFQLISL